MGDPALERRQELLKALLLEMKEFDTQIESSIAGIEKLSEVYYQNAFNECREEIQEEIEKYKKNNSRISGINHEITSKINRWYDFIKSTNEMSRLTFPVFYFLRKRKIQSELERLNDEISSITIDNRFIRERLTLLEHQLEIKALQKIKEDKNYLDYDRLLQKKDMLTAEVVYLLPTIPGLCPAFLYDSGVNELLEKLSTGANITSRIDF